MLYWDLLTRKRRNIFSESSELSRVLNLCDLTLLGVGSTLGLGIYVLAGKVALESAGPAVILSFLFAGIASAFAGFCYAEFAARVPKAGSAYIYSYVTVGEVVAFTIGWNLTLEYILGTSSVARGFSDYIDALFDNKMSKYWTEVMPMEINYFSKYPDFLAFIVTIFMTIILAAGVRTSTFFNNLFTVVNLVNILVIITAGSFKADTANWSIAKEDIPKDKSGGEGGFMPFGIAGVMAGAAKCFFGFVGFDCIATTGEEAKNPKRNIPLSMVFSLLTIFMAYFLISLVLTMDLPYYLQDTQAPFPHIFKHFGWQALSTIVSIGAIFALATSLLGAMFPLPRILYSMASDGLIYKFLQQVNPKTHTPVYATFLSGFLAALLATIFDVDHLIDMMNIGTLMAYTIVAICVLVLHYKPAEGEDSPGSKRSLSFMITQLTTYRNTLAPCKLTSDIVKVSVVIYSILSAVLAVLILFEDGKGFHIAMTFVVIFMLFTIMVIFCQPKDKDTDLYFKVPLVPFIPCFSISINIYLMSLLSNETWIRFVVWMAIGYFIYFTYGIRQSNEGKAVADDKKKSMEQIKK